MLYILQTRAPDTTKVWWYQGFWRCTLYTCGTYFKFMWASTVRHYVFYCTTNTASKCSSNWLVRPLSTDTVIRAVLRTCCQATREYTPMEASLDIYVISKEFVFGPEIVTVNPPVGSIVDVLCDGAKAERIGIARRSGIKGRVDTALSWMMRLGAGLQVCQPPTSNPKHKKAEVQSNLCLYPLQ